MNESYRCPRCGTYLVRSETSAQKVCFDCPDCAGRLVTLPVLRESLGSAGVAALTNAARALEHVGCRCPACEGIMGLAKVELDGKKVEIDVCGKCLSVWCDNGEFEALAPPRKSQKRCEPSMSELARKASPEARERLAAAMLEKLPEQVIPDDVTVGEVLMDVVRVIVGAPTLWRTIRPVTPLFSILLLVLLPVMQCVLHEATRGMVECGGDFVFRIGSRRDFWCLDGAMATCGFSMSSIKSVFSFPFVQGSGRLSLLLMFALLPVLLTVERRAGHARFLALLASAWAGAAVSHLVFMQVGLVSGALCGIGTIAFAFIAYALVSYPDLLFKSHEKGGMYLCMYAALSALAVLYCSFIGTAVVDSASAGFPSMLVCAAIGVCFAVIHRRK